MKKFLMFLFTITFLIGLVYIAKQPFLDMFKQSTGNFSESAKAMVVIDAENGEVLFQQNHQEALPIASMSKMMTQYLVLNAIDEGTIQWDQQYTPSEAVLQISARAQFSNLRMVQGRTYSIKTLFTAMTVNSSNDAAIALAEIVAGTEADFVKMMNEQATQMGLKKTVFYNATGLDGPYLNKSEAETNVASALEVATLAQQLLEKHPSVLSFTALPKFTTSAEQTFWNTNLMLPGMNQALEGIDGLKTGYTDLAGSCFTSTGVFDGRRIITVVMDVAANDQDLTTPKFALTRELIEHVTQ